jgi:hypothetical protein
LLDAVICGMLHLRSPCFDFFRGNCVRFTAVASGPFFGLPPMDFMHAAGVSQAGTLLVHTFRVFNLSCGMPIGQVQEMDDDRIDAAERPPDGSE